MIAKTANAATTAVATIDAPEAGTYTLRVTGDVPADARVSVGDVVDGGLLAGVAGAVGLFVTSLLAVVVTVVVALTRSVGAPDTRIERERTPIGS